MTIYTSGQVFTSIRFHGAEFYYLHIILNINCFFVGYQVFTSEGVQCSFLFFPLPSLSSPTSCLFNLHLSWFLPHGLFSFFPIFVDSHPIIPAPIFLGPEPNFSFRISSTASRIFICLPILIESSGTWRFHSKTSLRTIQGPQISL